VLRLSRDRRPRSRLIINGFSSQLAVNVSDRFVDGTRQPNHVYVVEDGDRIESK
jgi:hypothetical protein